MMQQQPQGGGMMSGLMGSVVTGMAMGTGSAIAHQAVGAISKSMFGGSTPAAAPAAAAPIAAAPTVCIPQNNSFMQCLQSNNNDTMRCNDFLEALSSCQRDAKQFA
jgi:hypothetical protein